MKKYLLIIALIVAVSAIGGGCYYLFGRKDVCKNVIPKDAKAVMVLDAKQLIRQLDISIKDILSLNKSDKDEKIGIDFLSPMYGFLSNERYLCGVFALSDAKDFEEAIKSKGVSVESQRGFNWGYSNQMMICFNDEKALLLGPISQAESNNMRQKMVEWMTQDEQKNPYFSGLKKQDGILKVCSSLGVVPDNNLSQYVQMLGSDFDLNSVLMNAAFNISDNALTLSVGMTSDDERFDKLIDQYNEQLRPIKADLLTTNSENPFLWFGANLDGEKLLESLRKNPLLRTALAAANMQMDLDKFLKSIDGDVSFEFADVINTSFRNWAFKAQVNNQDFLKNVSDWDASFMSSSAKIQSLSSNNYLLSDGRTNINFGLQDNMFYLSEGQRASAAVGNVSENSISALKSKIKGKRWFTTIDLSRLVNKADTQSLKGDDKEKADALLGAVDRLNISMRDVGNLEFEITTKEKTSDLIKGLLK